MKEATKVKVSKAKAFLSSSMGSDDFKKMIGHGLKDTYKERITLSEILTMDWFKDVATELKVSPKALEVVNG